ncbi:uncharacterized protein N7498_007557 [Penicillium cinerascens]|uniref:Uncharacterized protein n=1 Tax=Penicillium cinerascens TaxID=70096 RepID=A0A9W9JK52_9EURO|nr:uncharacterized protein N7498_007557 [Penicillium cinerascens]KAJ5198440.1 hypothetical protein N7498_007557 [Penicillium cinerascens]
MSSSPAKSTLKSASKADSKSSLQTNLQETGKTVDDAIKVLKPAELRILLIGQLYTDQAIRVDYAKLASKLGYTPGRARTVWNNARRKLTDSLDAIEGASPSPNKIRRAGRKKAKTPTPSDEEEKVAVDDDEAEDDNSD